GGGGGCAPANPALCHGGGGGRKPMTLPADAKACTTEPAIREELARGARGGEFARRYVEAVRNELFQRHLAGAGGLEIVHDFSAAVDRVLVGIFVYAVPETQKRFPPLPHPRI